jgi:transketolase N-terminal domain/subunit
LAGPAAAAAGAAVAGHAVAAVGPAAAAACLVLGSHGHVVAKLYWVGAKNTYFNMYEIKKTETSNVSLHGQQH